MFTYLLQTNSPLRVSSNSLEVASFQEMQCKVLDASEMSPGNIIVEHFCTVVRKMHFFFTLISYYSIVMSGTESGPESSVTDQTDH